jgi:TolB-like protein/tetratricopeptide (TPR) repeat protein
MTAVGALVLLAVVAVVVLGWRRIGAPDPVTLPDRIRVAVLPFVNLTGDATLDYFGDALTDDVISQLGQMGRAHVSVIARTSAMSYRKSSKTVAQIGEELGVRFVVESSVRRHGDHLRIATNLIRVSDGTAASSWNETFDAPSPGGQLQHTRATVRLARLIALELAPGVVPDHADASSVDAAAWNTFVTAKALANSGTASGARQALVLFETAAKQAPDFAAAWAKAAETRHLLVMMGGVAPGAMYPAAQVAANRAVQVDLNLADAHLALGLVQLWYEWRPGLAAKTFERALSLNPSLAAAHHDYAWSLVALGRNEDAVRHITTARALDPLSARANNDVGWLYLHLGDASEAMRACEHTLAIQPESLEAQACLERAYVLRDQPEAALAAAKATTPALSGSASSTASHAREALRSIWRWRLRQGEQAAQTRWMNPYTTAGLLAALGENDRAVASLEDAYDDRVGMMLHLARDPAFAALRRDPRLQALIRRVDQQRDR